MDLEGAATPLVSIILCVRNGMPPSALLSTLYGKYGREAVFAWFHSFSYPLIIVSVTRYGALGRSALRSIMSEAREL